MSSETLVASGKGGDDNERPRLSIVELAIVLGTVT